MDSTDNYIALVLGKRKTGKSVFVLGDESLDITGIIDIYFNKGMKVCIVDEIYHPSYIDVPLLDKENIKHLDVLKPCVFRCVAQTKPEMRELQLILAKYFWNGIIIFEDAFRYEKKSISEPLIKIIGNCKQQNVDVMLMYHHWKFVPLDLYIYLDLIELYKTKTPPSERELSELVGFEEEVMEAWKEVNNHPSLYYHKTICVTQ